MTTKDILGTIGGFLLILIPVDGIFSVLYFFAQKNLDWLPVMWSTHIILIILILIIERNID